MTNKESNKCMIPIFGMIYFYIRCSKKKEYEGFGKILIYTGLILYNILLTGFSYFIIHYL